MLPDLIIYIIVTTLAMRYAAPRLTSGKAAFAVREKNTLVMRALAIGLITVVYLALSISMNIGAPLLGKAIVSVLSLDWRRDCLCPGILSAGRPYPGRHHHRCRKVS